MIEELIKTKLGHQAVLSKIAKNIYCKVGQFAVEYAPSEEPIDKSQAEKLNYKGINIGKAWGKNKFCCAWFKLTSQKPKEDNLVALIDISGEGLVYDSNFKTLTSITSVSNKINMFQPFKGKQVVELDSLGEQIVLYMDAGYNGIGQSGSFKPILKKCDICVKNNHYHQLYYTYTAVMSAMYSSENKQDVAMYKQALHQAKLYLDQPLKALNELAKCYGEDKRGDVEYFAIGHGHLDLAWLWPIRESKRKAVRTISAQLVNIKNYKGFKYGVSQPQQLEWIKQSNKDVFDNIKEQVSIGNIEAQGGMWTECDCNLTGGESLIRQFYYGLEYWKKEFGKDVKTCWLPDVFGFSGALPQIIKGCGIDNFFTIKLSWNKVNKFPYNSFNWIGIDGTSVLAHISPFPDYTCTGSPFVFNKADKNYQEKQVSPVALVAYGVGDGGCGCNEANVEMVSHCNKLNGMPKVDYGTAERFFERLSKYKNKLPSYNGELYLEMHQGTFTSQAKNKWFNRKIEYLLHDIEFLQAQMLLKGLDYSAYNLDDIWKEILLYQFHDILPGSSIGRVYKESQQRYQEIYDKLRDMIQNMVNCIGGDIGYFNLSAANIETVIDIAGVAKILIAKPYSKAEIYDINQYKMSITDSVMDNGVIRVTFNKKGEIVSLYNYTIQREFASKTLNSIVVYSDPIINYNAWDIYQKYEKLPKKVLSCKVIGVSQFADRLEREVIYKYHNSIMRQKIVLKMCSQTLDIDTQVEWKESNKMLRADFYPSCFGGNVVCDTQFGYKTYGTHENNSYDKAKFEICAHKFVDTANDSCGMAIINDSKYGYRVKKGKISLNLLRSTHSPDPRADRGTHTFKYRIYPHSGDFIDADTQNCAYEFNWDLLPFALDAQQILTCDNNNIVIETIKPSYDGKGIAVRLYEQSGSEQKAVINTIPCKLYSANLLEQNQVACDSVLHFHKFEIKTIILKLR